MTLKIIKKSFQNLVIKNIFHKNYVSYLRKLSKQKQ